MWRNFLSLCWKHLRKENSMMRIIKTEVKKYLKCKSNRLSLLFSSLLSSKVQTFYFSLTFALSEQELSWFENPLLGLQRRLWNIQILLLVLNSFGEQLWDQKSFLIVGFNVQTATQLIAVNKDVVRSSTMRRYANYVGTTRYQVNKKILIKILIKI